MCLYVGGNAIILSGYHRDALISHNHIIWNGDSGIALVGDEQGIDGNHVLVGLC